MKKMQYITILLTILCQTVHATLPSLEIEALDALYQSTNGAQWLKNDQWTVSVACNRYGVTCNSDKTHVVGLQLSYNELQGHLPDKLGNLTELQTLTLTGNGLSGDIPSTLANLNQLTYLDFSGNQLSGNIPGEIWQMESLKHLNLSGNQLSGEIQISCSVVSPLQYLNLSDNTLTGFIPDCFGQMTSLSTLYLSNNQLSGRIPSSLSQLSHLNYLYLEHNELEGTISSRIGTLTGLQILRLNYNNLSGEIPIELGNLYQLTLLDLSHNKLSGAIPSTFGKLTQLKRLYLNDNALSGILPMQLYECKGLTVLFLSSNRLQGPIPDEWLYLTALQDNYCDFRWNALWTNTVSLKEFLDRKQNGQWDSYQTLPPTDLTAEKVAETSVKLTWTPSGQTGQQGSYAIYYSHQPDTKFQLYLTLDNLQTQTFTLNNIEPGVHYYFRMKTISEPHTNNDNRVESTYSDTIPVSILSDFPQIERDALIALYESTNGINWQIQTGWLGTSGSECSWFGIECNSDKNQVIRIQLANNGLSESLPQDIQNLSGLIHLDLRNNTLSGSIPDIIGNLTHLVHLDLSANNLSGAIPETIGQLNKLESLLLYDNQLSGEIPSDLGGMGSLSRLYLEKNQFSGSLPQALAYLNYLDKIRVHSNQFTGKIPDDYLKLPLSVGNSDFRWNALYSDNQSLVNFLNGCQRDNADWTKTQTVTPTNFRPGQALDNGMELLWTAIPYSVDPGAYEIYQARSLNGVFSHYRSIPDKAVSSIILSDLEHDQPYYFRIRTLSQAHANNNNTLVSAFSPTISVTYILHRPWISEIPDQTMEQDTYIDIPFSIGDDIISPNLLELTIQSSNTGLIPVDNITISGDSGNRVLRVSSAKNHVGTADITVSVKKDDLVTQTTFTVVVLAKENPPPQPTGLHVVNNSGHVQLAWDIIEKPFGVRYRVFRSSSVQGPFQCIHEKPVDMQRIFLQDCFIDPNVINGQFYVYKIKAEFYSIESTFSNPVQTIPQNVSNIKGDLNGDGTKDIADLILCLRVISDFEMENYIIMHVNGMGDIGLDEVIFLINDLGHEVQE